MAELNFFVKWDKKQVYKLKTVLHSAVAALASWMNNNERKMYVPAYIICPHR